MASFKLPLDPSLLTIAQHNRVGEGLKKRPCLADMDGIERSEIKYYLGDSGTKSDIQEKQAVVIRARCTAANLLGRLSNYVIQPMPGFKYESDDDPTVCYVRVLIAHLASRSAMQRMGAGLVVREWAKVWPNTSPHSLLESVLHTCLEEVIYYDEIAHSFTRLQQDSKDFIAMLKHYCLEVDVSFTNAPVLTLEQIHKLCGLEAIKLFSGNKLRPKVYDNLESRRKGILSNVSQTSTDQISLATTTQAVLAGAVVRLKILPAKLHPVIKPLMDSIKKEQNSQLQSMAASDLTLLLELCISKQPSPNKKILKNLTTFLCVDHSFTPVIIPSSTDAVNPTDDEKFKGIFTLVAQKKKTDIQLLRRTSSSAARGLGRPLGKPGRPPANAKLDTPAEITESILDYEVQKQNEFQRRGCSIALKLIVEYFGKDIPSKLPHLWDLIMQPFSDNSLVNIDDDDDDKAQDTINWLQLLEIIIPSLHSTLIDEFLDKLETFDIWLYNKYIAIRHMAARVISILASVKTSFVMTHIVENILPLCGAIACDNKRKGVVECIYIIIDTIGFKIVPYIVLLIVPLLGRNGDPNANVRLLSTQCFATLIRLLPIEGGVPDPPDLSIKVLERKQEQRKFLEQLMNSSKSENYEIKVPIKAELRSYQQEGVNWLAFLNRYQLHGILCDDMGLGKTLQSICMLAGEHFTRSQEDKDTKGCDSTPLISLVVCPPTLTGHWVYEVEKFVSREYLNPLHYTGPPPERYRLRQFFQHYNLIVASYDIVRNEVDFFSKTRWNYIILDEGHIIKNGKTKSSKAVKMLIANHRLILTGTPIQNNVLELWSLFDFLIPGFLGTERQFIAKYSKPILQSRDPKSTSKEQEAGVLAMEALHRQVLPFVLRRVKEDVLKDLPPKITQDYYCQLSPLQQKLYEDFARTRASQNINDSLNRDVTDDSSKPHSHIFQALQYLRRVCNHPKLVVKPQHPEYHKIIQEIKEKRMPLSDISHAAKLPALKQLLLDCGIGVTGGGPGDVSRDILVVSQHRALIFCQLKSMLDIIEKDLLKEHLPNVTYLRLDGSVPAGNRHSLVQRFNCDPSIDLLLLTTQVGGLGLNLTGADTVIFVEHDWNPMRDLQAMDRAHRIGQKKVVNVYRLITRGTLEEKIMGLQKFKIKTANTIISQENSSLISMGTDQILDLFTLNPCKNEMGYSSESSTDDSISGERRRKSDVNLLGMKNTGIKSVLDSLPELWDESQYESEYDLNNFMASLKK